MASLEISADDQLVIPQAIKDQLKISAGDRFEAVEVEGALQLVPSVRIQDLRGFAPGIDSKVDREAGDRA